MPQGISPGISSTPVPQATNMVNTKMLWQEIKYIQHQIAARQRTNN